jgi:hypothetical protein
MGSKSSSSSASKTYDYFGTIGMAVGIGPLKAIEKIVDDNKTVFEGVLTKSTADADPITITDRGRLRLHWGTATQTANATIANYETLPPFKNVSYLVGEDFMFGRERTNANNFQVVVTREPQQSIITGSAAQLNAYGQANIMAIAAEVITSHNGLGLSSSMIDATSWQTVADSLNTTDQQGLYAVSPSITSQVTVRDFFEQLFALSGVFIRRDANYDKFEAGRWIPPADLSSLVTITEADICEDTELDSSDMNELPTDYTGEFTDAARLFKRSSERVADVAALRVDGELRTENISSPEVTSRDQMRRRLVELQRQRRGGSLAASVTICRTKGMQVREGDYVRLDIDTVPGGAGSLMLMRVLEHSSDEEGPVSLQLVSEPAAAPVAFFNPPATSTPEVEILHPAFWVRPISLRPNSGEEPSVSILMARPNAQTIGVDVMYDTDSGAGTFPVIGTVTGFGQPCKLETAATASTTTFRVRTLDYPTAMGDSDIDRWLLSDGYQVSATEADDDRMLLVLIKKNVSTGALIDNGSGKWVEICSISGISMVSTDLWDVTVNRGRMGTAPLDFNEGSFPDDYYRYECWVIPGASLERYYHKDFLSNVKNQTTGWLRLRPYSARSVYDPADAYAAGKQTWAGWLPWSFLWPVADLTPAVSGVGFSGITILNANVVNTLSTPSVSPSSQLFTGTLTLSLLVASGYTVRYSTTGAVTANSQEWPKSGGSYTTLGITTTTTLRVRAFSGGAQSDELICSYTLDSTSSKVAAPTFLSMVAPGGTATVTLGCATSGATIYWRKLPAGGSWTSWATTGTITLGNRTALEAYATKSGMYDSDLLEFVWEYDPNAYWDEP